MGLNYAFKTDLCTAPFYSQLEEFDLFTNQTRYKDQLGAYFRSGPTRPKELAKLSISVFSQVKVPIGNDVFYSSLNSYTAARAYVAYKDAKYLDFAVKSWGVGRNYTFVDTSAPPAIQTPRVEKAFDAQSKCDNAISMIGGLATGLEDTFTYASDTGRFLR
ncbi:hypothetical protein Moror_9314 [Moniliophthora roreri MCA 2997]|uniref:Uncharacterized protein n=1 Tax=Moniliophthora roreri (strain MCA 2997) TaxID=1381753 RepID=V2Y3D7_MONRO|nr:hypothetical protein Moror_9314 [Moniliophthora roreri MCA 2997]